MTVATVIYYSGYHPYTLKPTKTPKSKKEKEEQHRFFFWYKKENKGWITKTLNKLGRKDLVEALVPETENNSWRSIKPKAVKNTFDDAVPASHSKQKNKRKSRNKRR